MIHVWLVCGILAVVSATTIPFCATLEVDEIIRTLAPQQQYKGRLNVRSWLFIHGLFCFSTTFFIWETFEVCVMMVRGSLITLCLALTPVKSDPWCRPPRIKARTRYGSFFLRCRHALIKSPDEKFWTCFSADGEGHSRSLMKASAVKSDLVCQPIPQIKAKTQYGTFFHLLPPIHCFHQWPRHSFYKFTLARWVDSFWLA